MATYATPAELRAYLDDLTVDQLSDAAAERLLASAERRIDSVAGAVRMSDEQVRKYVPTDLPDFAAEALTDATLLVAEAEYTDPRAFTVPEVGSVKGPDFEINRPLQGRTAPGAPVLREAVEILDGAGLRVLTARAHA